MKKRYEKVRLFLMLGVVVSLANSSQALIVYSGIQNLTIQHNSDDRFNFRFAGAPDIFTIEDGRKTLVVYTSFAGSYSYLFDDGSSATRIVTAFEVGDAIHSGLEWRTVGFSAMLARYNPEPEDRFGLGNFFDQTDRYLPIRTVDDDAEYFGWLRLSHSQEDEQLTIHDWAWNSTPGEPILAGEIPEPAAYAVVFGIGALGFVFLRRRFP